MFLSRLVVAVAIIVRFVPLCDILLPRMTGFDAICTIDEPFETGSFWTENTNQSCLAS